MNPTRPKFVFALTVAASVSSSLGFLTAASDCDRCEKWGPLESRTYQSCPKSETQPGRASVTVISLGLIDQVQIVASGLAPGQEYTLSMVDPVGAPHVHEPLTRMKASPAGTIIANTLGPVRGFSSEKAGPAPVAFVLESTDEKAAPA